MSLTMHSDFDVVVLGAGIVGSAIATGLATKGHNVALIERGGQSVSEQIEARPLIKCTERMHIGCLRARNHVLGGNGHYWGGGLMRPPNLYLGACLGQSDFGAEHSESLENHFQNVERGLGVHRPPRRTMLPVKDPTVGQCHLAEICVLPGKKRNPSQYWLKKFQSMPHCQIFTGSEVKAFSKSQGRKVSSVLVDQRGFLREIAGRSFVIATGVIDSNLLVLAHAGEFGVESRVDVGSRLHDHLSVPIARVRISSDSAAKGLLAPRFRNGLVVGRHFELGCETGWGAEGFLHFTMRFDDLSPYREIKQLMLLRQQGAPVLDLVKSSFPILSRTRQLMNVAIERFVKRQLYLSDGLCICATLDFETFPNDANTVRLAGDCAELSWNIRDQDEFFYLELLKKANRLVAELGSSYGLAVEPLADFSSRSKAIDYLYTTATDAFHLGGGLAAGHAGTGVIDRNLLVSGSENVYVISSAVLRRSGVVNPTHTLLALADRFVSSYRRDA